MKKIAVIIPDLKVGGAERLLIEELTFFYNTYNHQFEFEVILVFGRGEFLKVLQDLGVKYHVWNAPHKSIFMILAYWQIVMYLRANNFDILHCHLLNSIGPIIGRISGIKKIITTVHSDKKFNAFEKFGLRRNNITIACGKIVAHKISRFLYDRNVKILSNAIGEPHKSQAVLFESYYKSNNTVLLAVGSLNAHKGYDVLINAISLVRKSYSKFILLVAGEGRERRKIEILIEELQLSAHVKLLGIVDDIHSLLPCADIFINSSKREGLPMTLIEAMAHGIPIVATDVGGNSEVVIENETGFLINSNDPRSLADAILKLIKDDTLRRDLGGGARTLFQRQYRIDTHCHALSIIYCD
jgi:L-malate glycosyltransferase